jgi:hypothetical protein
VWCKIDEFSLKDQEVIKYVRTREWVFESTIESPLPRKIIIAMLLAATLPDVVQFSGVDECNCTDRGSN